MFNLDDEPLKGNEMPTLFTNARAAEARRAKAYLADRLKRVKSEGRILEEVELTPCLAELLLGANSDNRTLNKKTIDQIATDIRNGAWDDVNGETIIVSEEGLLNDGQHRCWGVIKAGKSVKTAIVIGVDRRSRLSVDQGEARTVGNYLSMDGVDNANTVAGCAKLLWQHDEAGGVSRAGGRQPTKAQIMATAAAHPAIHESIAAIPSSSGNPIRSPSMTTFFHYVFARIDRRAADEFIGRLVVGDKLDARDPIFLCRARLLANNRMRPEEKVELVFRAWNLYRSKRRQSKFSLTGSYPVLR